MLKIFMTVLISAIFMLLLITFRKTVNDNISKKPFAIDLKSICNLETYPQQELDETENRYLVIIYFNFLSCETCVNRELDYVNQLNEFLNDSIDFLLIAYLTKYSGTMDKDYLRRIRRIGKVRFPMLIEDNLGSTVTTDRFHICLVDKSREMIVLRYFPETGRDSWERFEEILLEIIKT